MIKKRNAIKTLENMQAELDKITDLNQAEHWRNLAISHMTEYIGTDNQITTSLRNFRIAKPAYKPELSPYSNRVIQVSYDEFDPLKKYDGFEIIDNAITYIKVHGILTPQVKYDNPFTGMSFVAHCWLWGSLAVGASALLPLAYNYGKNQGDEHLKDQTYQFEQLKDSIRMVNLDNSLNVIPIERESLPPPAKKVKMRKKMNRNDSLNQKF